MKKIIIPAKISQISKVNSFIQENLKDKNCLPEDVNNILLAVEEIFVNIASYAYSKNNGKVIIKFSFNKKTSTVNLCFLDNGKKFNPLENNNVDFSFKDKNRDEGGLGIFLVKNLIDDISYKFKNKKNILHLIKHINIKQTKSIKQKEKIYPISKIYRNKLIKSMTFIFFIALITTIIFQIFSTRDKISNLLRINIEDIEETINVDTDWYLTQLSKTFSKIIIKTNDYSNKNLKILKNANNIEEINIVDSFGIVQFSSEDKNIGMSFYKEKEASDFLCLLDDSTTEFVQDYFRNSVGTNIQMKFVGIALDSGGFIQFGFTQKSFSSFQNEITQGLTENRHIDESGGLILLDSENNILSCPNEHKGKQINILLNKKNHKSIFTTKIYDIDSYCLFTTMNDFNIIAFYPIKLAVNQFFIELFILLIIEILTFIILFFEITKLNKRLVLNNIEKINKSLNEISNGNLGVIVDVKSNREFIELSDDINKTVATLKRYIKKESERIEQDLKYANIVQSSALPGLFPPFTDRKEFDIYASMIPAKVVGGDFYDFYYLNKTTLVFEIADVSDKGIPAAMFMMSAKTMIKSCIENYHSTSVALEKANNQLYENNKARMFLTIWIGILDIETGVLTYSNAGHNQPLIKRNDSFEYIQTQTDFILAGLKNQQYKEYSIKLNHGDTIFLYTDGITEANNFDKKMFGENRLKQVLNNSIKSKMSPKDLCENVKKEVDLFANGTSQSDDITMLCVQYNKKI